MTISLRSLIIVPLVLQIVGITSVVGYLSYRSGQRAVETLASQLMAETGDLISQDLDRYLQSAHHQNQSAIAALQSQVISFDNLDRLHRYLTFQLKRNTTAQTLLFANPQGDLRVSHRVTETDFGINTRLTTEDSPYEVAISTRDNPLENSVYSIDAQGNPDRLLMTIRNLDGRQRPWYRRAMATEQAGWTEPFQLGSTNHLVISAYVPVYDPPETLAGVFAVNLNLQELDAFLQGLTFSKLGQAFIVQPDGTLLAQSIDQASYWSESPLYGQQGQPPIVTQPDSVQFDRLLALDSPDPVTRAAFAAVQGEFEALAEVSSAQELPLEVEGDRYFLRLTPYHDDHGLDWFIMTAVPQSALIGSIRTHIYQTVALCSGALIGSIAFSIWLTRRITRPLEQLSWATQAYARGEPSGFHGKSLISEIQSLGTAFTAMMAQTDAQTHQLDRVHEDYARSLEQTITARTAELKATTDKLREAQRVAQVGSWEFDLATQKLAWSEELFRILGRDPALGEPSYDRVFETAVPADRERLQVAVEHLIATGEPYAVEQQVIRPDGTHCYVLSRGEAQLDEHGQVTKLYGTTADITELKTAELALTASETKRRLALELTNTGSWEFDIATGEADWSDSHYRLMGVTPSEVPACYAAWRDRVHPDDLAAAEMAIQRAIDQHALLSVEYRVVHPNNEVRWMLTKGHAVYAEDGTPLKMLGVMMDISDRKLADLKLKKLSEELSKWRDRYEIATQNAQQVIFEYDFNRDCYTFSADTEAALGVTAENLPRTLQDSFDLTHPDDLPRLQAALATSRTAPDHAYRVEIRIWRGDGEYLWVEDQAKLQLDAQGNPIRVVGSLRNISDRKRLEAERDAVMAQLQELATTDALTKVANRRQFLSVLAQEWSRHQRETTPLSLVMIDIDHFKRYNDTYGHPAGDRCLVQIAQLLQRCTRRSGDLVARYGGEEFIVLLPNTNLSGVEAIAQTIHKQLAKLAIPHRESVTDDYVTVSLGIAVVNMPTEIDEDAAISAADDMLYKAKQIRNTYRIREVS